MATKEHPNGYYNYSKVMEIASSCNNYNEFRKKYPGAREAAVNNGWISDVKSLLPHKTYWSRDMCIEEIRKKGYKNKKQFREGSPGAYSHAAKRGFLDEICRNMEVLGHYNLRCIYVYEFEDDYAYVGLTGNMNTRNNWHIHSEESPVYHHFLKTGSKFELKIISDWMSKEKAQIYENEMINIYSAIGWHMLNRKRGGDLGGAREPKYSIDELKAAVSTCIHRKEFKTKYSAMYAFILNHNLRDEVLGQLPEFYMPPLYWTDDKLWEAVKNCNYSKGILQDKYPGAYLSILRKNRFEEFFGSPKRKIKRRNRQQAIEECRQFKTLSELMKKDQGLYTYVRRHHLEGECFKNIEMINMHADYTWEDILMAINSSRNLTQMREEHTSEYRAALRKSEWRHELYKRLPSRKHKSNH